MVWYFLLRKLINFCYISKRPINFLTNIRRLNNLTSRVWTYVNNVWGFSGCSIHACFNNASVCSIAVAKKKIQIRYCRVHKIVNFSGKIEPRILTSCISETGCHKHHGRDVPPSWTRHASNHKFHVVIKGVVINRMCNTEKIKNIHAIMYIHMG